MFGLNILAQTVGDRQHLLNYLEQTKPRSVVVMDDLGFALAVRKTTPQTTVVYRSYDPHDHESHYQVAAADWFAQHAPLAQEGLVLQVLNEPNGYGDLQPLVKWCVEIMMLAAQQNIRVCLPNFAVGHPKEDFGAELDDLLRAFDRYPQHILGVHEYAQNSTRDERPYRIGRFSTILRRADALGLRRPQVIVTEHGRDVGGGVNDGWRGLGLSEEAYSSFLTDCSDIYNEYDASACIFCYGIGADARWRSFDVEHAETLLDKLAAFNKIVQPKATPPQPTETPTVTINTVVPKPDDAGTGVRALVKSVYVNVRIGPGINYFSPGQVHTDEEIRLYPSTEQEGDNYHWVYVEKGALKGWAAREVLVTEEILPLGERREQPHKDAETPTKTTTQPPVVETPTESETHKDAGTQHKLTPDAPSPFPLTIDEMRQALAMHQELARLHQQETELHEKLVALYMSALGRDSDPTS
jgi:hypothetical protein